jgi:hypothetical protein
VNRASFLVASASLLAAEVSHAQADDGMAFDPRDFAAYARTGPYEIQSTIAIAEPGGETRSRAGVVVSAYPDRPFTRAWLRASAQAIALRGHGPAEFDDPPPPAQLVRYRHTATTDEDGAFVIRGLTAGSWALRGLLSIAFPRAVSYLRSTPVGYANGAPVVAQEVVNETVSDFSFLWLDATSVGVGLHFVPQVYFHVVARRNKLWKSK